MELTKEERQLKEAMKIILRDGKDGKLYAPAKARYQALSTPDRLHNMAHEIDGVDWTTDYAADAKEIDAIIQNGK